MTRLLAWLGFLVGALAGLHASSIPAVDGVSAAFAAVRVIALCIWAYLLVVTILGVLARALRLGAAVRLTDVVTVPFVRRILNRAATVALAASLVAPVGAGAAERPAEPPPVMRLIDEPPPPAAAPAPAPAPAPSAEEYAVKPGDNLWSISQQLLAAQLGRPPSDHEIVPHWQALISANADRVRDPSLIFSGQVLRVPGAAELPRTD